MQEALIKTIAMPRDIDKEGKISAAFILTQLDLAAGIAVKELTGNRSVTIAMDKIHYKKPILLGDYVLCFAKITKLGKSSISLKLHIDVKRLDEKGFSLVKELISAEATFVSLDKEGRKISLEKYSLKEIP